MIPVIAVAVSLFFALALTLASTEKFSDNLKRNRVLIPVLCADAVYLAVSLVLFAVSMRLTPAVSYIAAAVLIIVTLFAVLVGAVKNAAVYVVAVLLSVIIGFVTVLALPEDYVVKEFEGEEYVGVAKAENDLKYFSNYIYYYKSKAPLILSYHYDYSEFYGIRSDVTDWDEITKDGPHELNYYENGKLVRKKPIYDWIK